MLGGKKVKYGGQPGIEVGTLVQFPHPETGKTRAGIVERRDFTTLGDKTENTYLVRDFHTREKFVVRQEQVTVSPVQQPILPETPPGTPTASGRKRKTHKKKLRSKKRKTYTRR